MASSLGSCKQSRRGGEVKAKDTGFLTMEDFKEVNFCDEFHQSMCSIDRLVLALGALIEKQDRSNKTHHQFKKVRFFLGSSSNSSPLLHHQPLAPGLLHGQYFNVAFDEKKNQRKVNGVKRLAPPNWVLQGCPKKPRSAMNSQKPHPPTDAILNDGELCNC